MQEGRSKEKLDAILTVSIKRIDTGFNVNTTPQSNLGSKLLSCTASTFFIFSVETNQMHFLLPLW